MVKGVYYPPSFTPLFKSCPDIVNLQSNTNWKVSLIDSASVSTGPSQMVGSGDRCYNIQLTSVAKVFSIFPHRKISHTRKWPFWTNHNWVPNFGEENSTKWFQDVPNLSSRLKNSGFVAAYEIMMTFSNIFWTSFLVISTTLVVFEIATFTSNMRASDVLSRPKIQPKSRPQIYLNTSQVPELKRILYWTPYFMAEDWQFGFGSKPFRNCPQPNCAGDNFTRNMFYHHHPRCHQTIPTKCSDEEGGRREFWRNSVSLILLKPVDWRTHRSTQGEISCKHDQSQRQTLSLGLL